MKKLKCDETLDRLSELPDSVIFEILAFLEMRDVVRTALLSKRWQHLWTTIPCLKFSEFGKETVRIRNFVNRGLMVWRGANSEETVKTRNFINRALMLWKGAKILKFEIDFSDEGIYESLCGDMDLWLRIATERNVQDLCLKFEYDFFLGRGHIDSVYTLPQFVYSCSSITKLSVFGCILQVHGALHWHQLKSLTIHVFSVSEDDINKLLSGTPQLETFDLYIYLESYENLSIHSSSLKQLSIKKYINCREYDPSKYTMLTIWAPNLEDLVISGPPFSTCLLKDVSSLTHSNLNFRHRWGDALGVTLRQILPTFQHVEAITLSSSCFKVLQVMKDKFTPSSLPNVKKLSFTCELIKPREVVGLLEIFPKLKMLDINREPGDFYPTFHENINSEEQDVGDSLNSEINIIESMMQLRIVEIGWHFYEGYWQNTYDKSLLKFVVFLLKHANMLGKMVIQQRGDWMVESENMMRTAEKLLSLQRSFPIVELIFRKE